MISVLPGRMSATPHSHKRLHKCLHRYRLNTQSHAAQATTTRVWVARMTGAGSLALLPGRMGALHPVALSCHFCFCSFVAQRALFCLQDTTTRVWDVRMTGAGSLAVLPGRMGAVRSLRYSPCGRVLAVAEPADFVTLYNAANDYQTAQEVRKNYTQSGRHRMF